MQFTTFDAFLQGCFILSFELNKAFDDIALKIDLHFKVLLYKTMVKPNFLVYKATIKHKPYIYTKKILWVNAEDA